MISWYVAHVFSEFIIIIIIPVIIITFMLSIYNYIPETNHVSRVYSVAAVLYLQFVLNVILFRMLNVLHIYISGVCLKPDGTPGRGGGSEGETGEWSG
jgi:Na+/H+-dicarboxylate symporter